MSGEFAVVNEHLVRRLRDEELWDEQFADRLVFYDGTLQQIDGIDDSMKEQFKIAFEIEPEWLIEAAARRQKWIDMGQSLNLYLAEPSGRKLNDMYMKAWKSGLKTTYYLRSLGASQIEKSTMQEHRVEGGARWRRGADPASADPAKGPSAAAPSVDPSRSAPSFPRDMDDIVCDACQ